MSERKNKTIIIYIRQTREINTLVCLNYLWNIFVIPKVLLYEKRCY